MKKLMPKLKGFTIIEVIIVLVIGAVIMLAVFLVIPQLQRQNRESQMRQAATRVLLAARECNNTNCTPLNVNANITGKIKNYTGIIKNPKTNVEYGYSSTIAGAALYANNMWIMLNTSCSSTNNHNTIGASSGSIAVIYNVEPYLDNANQDGQKRCVSD